MVPVTNIAKAMTVSTLFIIAVAYFSQSFAYPRTVILISWLLTAAFIADAPLRSAVRTAIDAEIHRGAGA